LDIYITLFDSMSDNRLTKPAKFHRITKSSNYKFDEIDGRLILQSPRPGQKAKNSLDVNQLAPKIKINRSENNICTIL